VASAKLLGSAPLSLPAPSDHGIFAMKINGNAIRPGYIIEHQARLWRAVRIMHTQPGKGGAYLQVELKDVRDGTKLNERFRSSETVERVQLDAHDYQFLFAEGEDYTFMDAETFEQITLKGDLIGDPVVFLQEGTQVSVQSHEGEPLSVTLPDTVTMRIVEADPVVRGQTASSSYKPAKLENGVRVMVPPHVESGVRIVVNTADSSYVERAKD
jgi:elongation factor P